MPALAPTKYKSILDLKTQNWEDGSDERYDTSRMTPVGDGRYTFGGYFTDSEGRPLDSIPGARNWTPGLIGARGGNGPGGVGANGGNLLAGDSMYNQLMQDLKAQSISDKASRDASIKKSFINFGLGNFDLAKAAASTGIGDLAEILDPQTLELAKNNQFSVMKRLESGLGDRQRDNRVSLRQRGGVRSGESGFLADRAQKDFDTGIYDSTQQLLDFLSGSQSAFAQAEQARKRAEWEAAMAAASRYSGGGGGGDYDDYSDYDPSFGLAPSGNYLFGGVDQLLSQAAPKKKKPAAPTYRSKDIKSGPRRNAGGV